MMNPPGYSVAKPPPYEVGDLDVGWVFRSPIDRLETVTCRAAVASQSWMVRIWTDRTGSDYSWVLPRGEVVEALPRRPDRGRPEIRIIDRPRSGGWPGLITAELTWSSTRRPSYDIDRVLVEAAPADGSGWTVADHPGGGDLAVSRHDTKAKARTALLRAARAHAKALGGLSITDQKDMP
nr:hypothetical protein [Micromonospora sp. DSM 115978]